MLFLLQAAAAAEFHRPAFLVLSHADDDGVQSNRVAQARVQSVRQDLQAFVKGKLFRMRLGHFLPALALGRAQNLAFDERAVLPLQLVNLGKAC